MMYTPTRRPLLRRVNFWSPCACAIMLPESEIKTVLDRYQKKKKKNKKSREYNSLARAARNQHFRRRQPLHPCTLFTGFRFVYGLHCGIACEGVMLVYEVYKFSKNTVERYTPYGKLAKQKRFDSNILR